VVLATMATMTPHQKNPLGVVVATMTLHQKTRWLWTESGGNDNTPPKNPLGIDWE
jgi:hypothetical protein